MLLRFVTVALLGASLAQAFIREEGRCAMRGGCGRKGTFGGELPCPDNELATLQEDPTYLATLDQVCGADFSRTTCCTLSQLETLSSSLAQAEPLIATCPACRSNFRHWFCSFTCSPNQSLFVLPTALQIPSAPTNPPREAIKSVLVSLAPTFGKGLYDSCKDIKFGATNGLAMDLLGGGAKDWLGFLRFLGTERALGSPFQIDFEAPEGDEVAVAFQDKLFMTNSTATPFDESPLSCSSSDLASRCACPDCPAVCASLPPIRSPAEKYAHRCRVGRMSCFTFSLIIVYGVLLLLFLSALGVLEFVKRRAGGARREMNIEGKISSTFSIFLGYLKGSWAGRSQTGVGGRDREGYQSVPMEDPLLSEQTYDETPPQINSTFSAATLLNKKRKSTTGSSTRSGSGNRGANNALVGQGSTAGAYDGESLNSSTNTNASRRPNSGTSSATRRSAGPSILDPNSSTEDGDYDGADDSNPFLQPRTYLLNRVLSTAFYSLGLFCAKNPFLTIALGLAISGLINIGWKRFEVEKDPVRLWVAKGSQSAKAKEMFDEGFGPFYRTEQIFLSVDESAGTLHRDGLGQVEAEGWTPSSAPVLSWETLQWWFSVEASIRTLSSSPNNYTLSSVCFSPSTSPDQPQTPEPCVVQSPLGYFQNEISTISERTWKASLDTCTETPVACLPTFGQPMNPKLVLSSDFDNGGKGSDATAVIVTYVVSNSLDPTVVRRAQEWERTLRDFLRDVVSSQARDRGLRLDWSTEISLEEELNKSSNTDVPIVVLSYLVMFLYVSINLGSSGAGLLKGIGQVLLFLGHGAAHLVQMLPPLRKRQVGRNRSGSVTLSLAGSTSSIGAYFKMQLLVDSKFLLGLWGIVIVLLSVSTSVALFSATGVKVTLIIAEVIPFLVLAIGVDNVFILSHELDQQNARAYSNASRNGVLGTTEGDDDNDDALPPAEERVARALGRMGPSILLSATCETVAFGLGAMVGMPAVRNFAIYAAGAVVINALLQITVFVSAMAIDLKRVESNRIDCFPCFKLPPSSSLDLGSAVSEGVLARFIRTIYAPTLLKKPVKFMVTILFSGLFVLSWIGSRHITLGLDQRLALPSSSYLINYFNALDSFLDVGPPVYFVSKGLDVTSRTGQQKLCGRFSTCNELSLANVLEAERKRPDSSFIAEPAAVWLDDFFQWLNPLLEDCCRVKKRDPTSFCGPEDSSFICQPCFEDREPAWNITMNGLPEGDEFMRYLNQWLASPTDESCPLGGKAAYSTALDVVDDQVSLSHFRTYHTPLKTQADFINAVAAAQRVAQDLSKRTGAEVFPYSLFYVYFDQYAHIVATTREVLVLALLAVFTVTSIFLGSWRTGTVVLVTVFLSVLSVMGVMGVWGISLNAISLVNLVISVGIAVEFCSHIARAFMGANGGGLAYNHPAGGKDRDDRAWAALVDVGSSVLSGITLTKLIGISVLALTRSKLLEVYFFRMWLALIVSGALHGLVFLPVALSFWGGQGYSLLNEDAEFLDVAVRTRYERASLGFVDDDDEGSDTSDRF